MKNKQYVLIEDEYFKYIDIFEDFNQLQLSGLSETVILLDEDLEDKITKSDQMVEKYITDFSKVSDNYEKSTRVEWALEESFRYIEVGMRVIQVLTAVSLVSKKADKVYSAGSKAIRYGQNALNDKSSNNDGQSNKTKKVNKLITIVVSQIIKVISKILKNFMKSKRMDSINKLKASRSKLIRLSKLDGLSDLEKEKLMQTIKRIDATIIAYEQKYAGKV